MAKNETRELIAALNTEGMTLDEIAKAVGLSSSGTVQYHLKKLGRSSGGFRGFSAGTETTVKAPRQTKAAGCLPKRVEFWVVGQLARVWEDQGNDPDDYIPDEVTREIIETLIVSDRPNWNGLVRKLGLEEIEAFETWLGTECTVTRRNELGYGRRLETARNAALDHAARLSARKAALLAEIAAIETELAMY